MTRDDVSLKSCCALMGRSRKKRTPSPYEIRLLNMSTNCLSPPSIDGEKQIDCLPVENKKTLENDDKWHESQMNAKMLIDKKIEEYVMSFTVHSLTKIMRGRKLESLFWVLMLMGSMLLSILVCYGLMEKYLSYGIYTEIRSVVTDQNYFPSVTFCENKLLMDSYFSYCGISASSILETNQDDFCTKKATSYAAPITSGKSFWSNGMFNFSLCATWDGKNCLNEITSLQRYNHSCVTWNLKGKLHDIYSHVLIRFSFKPPAQLKQLPDIIAIPHDHEINELDITNKVDIDLGKSYEIKLDKTFIKRLKDPYPSNCTDRKQGDIFLGKYSRRSCIESGNYIRIYKLCGSTLDYVRPFIPQEVIDKYTRNTSISAAYSCIMNHGTSETKSSSNCRFPCEALDLGVLSTFKETKRQAKGRLEYSVQLQLQRVDTYKVLEEKVLYTWDQMACEIGGFIGLVMGASVLSFVEIFVYIVLKTLRKFLSGVSSQQTSK